MACFIHTIEFQLAIAPPIYKRFSRKDAFSVLQDSVENLVWNGGQHRHEVPELLRSASAFNEFYEGALGTNSTDCVFGFEIQDAIQRVREIADLTEWEELRVQLANTENELLKVSPDVLQEYFSNRNSSEDHEKLWALLVGDFEEIVQRDRALGYPKRKHANAWLVEQLDPSICDDEQAPPLLPCTREAAKHRLGDVKI